MKRILISQMAALLMFAAGLYGQLQEPPCSTQTLRGSYGVMVTGTAPASSVLPKFSSVLYPVGTIEQFVGVVVHTFDGDGTFTQTDYIKGSLSGAVLNRPGAGTYSVNRDCSGTYSIFIPGLSFPVVIVRFVLVDGGREFRGIVVTPEEAIATFNGRKMH